MIRSDACRSSVSRHPECVRERSSKCSPASTTPWPTSHSPDRRSTLSSNPATAHSSVLLEMLSARFDRASDRPEPKRLRRQLPKIRRRQISLQQEIHQITLLRVRLSRTAPARTAPSVPREPALICRLQRRIPIDQSLLIDAQAFRNEPDPLFPLDRMFALLKNAQDFIHAADPVLRSFRTSAVFRLCSTRKIQQAGRRLLKARKRLGARTCRT